MLRECGCDGVMIGRASMKNPWIYRQASDLLAGREPYQPTLDDRRNVILTHFRLLLEQEEEAHALHKLRTFTGWYTHGLTGGRRLRLLINSLTSPEAFIEAVENFFDSAQVAA
jgi:tRNA-dihydrouridine synthase